MTAADDERRAEIEAVKRTRPKVGALISAWRRYADDLEAALDRVRDARGWDTSGERGRLLDEIGRLEAQLAAQSPQGEDHETIRLEQPPPDKLGGQPPAEPRSHDDLWDNPAKGP